MVHRLYWTELTEMQLPYGSPTVSSRQASLLYCIGVSSVIFPTANNNVTLMTFILG